MINIHLSGRRIGEIDFSWKRPPKPEIAQDATPSDKPATTPKTEDEERPKLTAGTHLASSERANRWFDPDTIAFGFGRQ